MALTANLRLTDTLQRELMSGYDGTGRGAEAGNPTTNIE
jgi:hypothetical protein